jgi:hypothetical protein
VSINDYGLSLKQVVIYEYTRLWFMSTVQKSCDLYEYKRLFFFTRMPMVPWKILSVCFVDAVNFTMLRSK